jgi:hypothetical protein
VLSVHQSKLASLSLGFLRSSRCKRTAWNKGRAWIFRTESEV